ncbi:hypothetical protein ACV33Y_10915 [Pseudomonas aeruginosa]
MSSTQHQLIEQCATRLRGIVEALDNIHDSTPHRWSTDLDDVHSSAESLLALIKDQAPTPCIDCKGTGFCNSISGEEIRCPCHAPIQFADPAQAPVEQFEQAPPSEDQLTAAGLSYPLAKEDAVKLWYAGFRSEVVTVLEAWEAIGHDIGMNPDKGELLDSLRYMLEKCEAHDAALARVAELERQEPVALANRGNQAFWVKWTEAAAGLYGPGIKLYAAPVAQAQHSVPEGYALIPVRETEAMHDAVMALLYKGVARTDTQKLLDAYIAAAPGNSVPQAWLDVQAERRRQVEAEGWTPEHDDQHSHGQMARAAACYALAGSSAPNDETAALLVSLAWPWDEQWWKPSTARRDLIKAGALVLAEIERLDRAGISQSPQPGATTASS